MEERGHHARHPPGSAAGAVRARQPAARGERQRGGNGRRLRGRPRARAARRARSPMPPRSPPTTRPEPGHEHDAARHPGHALRRLQARERGDGRRLLGRLPDPEHRPAAAHGLRPRPRSGRDVRGDEGDARRRRRHVVPDPLRRAGGAAARARRRARSSSPPRAPTVEGAAVLDPPGAPGRDGRDRGRRSTLRSRIRRSTVGFDDVVSMGVPEQGDTTAFVALLGDLPTMPAARGRRRDDRELPRPAWHAAS